jgi:hypothetical protein
MRTADELIRGVVNGSQLPSLKRHYEIRRELRSHIEDFIAAELEAGHTEQEIEALLLARFGDPAQIAQDFSQVYKSERRKLLTLVYMLSTAILASSVLVAILAVQAGLSLSFGTPILEILASRHTVIQALDIFAFVAAYLGFISLEPLFSLHRFQKASLLIAMIAAILIAVCNALGLHPAFLVYGLLTGIFVRAMRLYVPAKALRTVIVLVGFALAGLGFALLHSQLSPTDLLLTCISWLAIGSAYLSIGQLVPHLDSALRNKLQHI